MAYARIRLKPEYNTMINAIPKMARAIDPVKPSESLKKKPEIIAARRKIAPMLPMIHMEGVRLVGKLACPRRGRTIRALSPLKKIWVRAQ